MRILFCVRKEMIRRHFSDASHTASGMEQAQNLDSMLYCACGLQSALPPFRHYFSPTPGIPFGYHTHTVAHARAHKPNHVHVRTNARTHARTHARIRARTNTQRGQNFDRS
jgi:hypothetical protein